MFSAQRVGHLAGCAWFWAWAAVGVGFALSFVSFIGVLTFLPTMAVAGLLWRFGPRSAAFGLWTGAGALLLYIAWLQREGPGTTCWQTASARGCDTHLNPLPWLVLGLVLLTSGIVAYARRR